VYDGSPTFVEFSTLDGSHSYRNGVESQHDFDFNFLYGQECCTFLHVFLAIWTAFFERALFSSFAHFFIGSLIFGGVQFLGLPVYSGY
jgi:hypothetical protein